MASLSAVDPSLSLLIRQTHSPLHVPAPQPHRISSPSLHASSLSLSLSSSAATGTLFSHHHDLLDSLLPIHSRVRETIVSLNARKIISKKTISKSKSARRRDRKLKRLKPYDLSALSEVLPELTEPQEPAPAKFNLDSKSRQKLVLKEGKQLMTVLNHHAFQSDPLAAIHHHLQETQPIEGKKPVPKKAGGAKKKKKKKSKSTAGSRPMDL